MEAVINFGSYKCTVHPLHTIQLTHVRLRQRLIATNQSSMTEQVHNNQLFK
jgi:hypothetical protein